jgi:hypothetical protein
MAEFTVEFRDRNFDPIPMQDLSFSARQWAGSRSRGPTQAEVFASGSKEAIWSLSEKLGFELRIKNANGTVCWWGKFTRIEMQYGSRTVGLSLDDMANKIRVRYSHDAPGGTVSGTTEWTEDARSIVQYGIKTLTENADQTTLAEAEYRRDTMLEFKSLPVGTASGGSGSALAPGMATARIYGIGWTETLAWQPYEQLQGRLVQDEGGKEQIMGYGFTEALGFKNHVNTVHSVGGYFLNLPEGTLLELSGMAANNGTFTVDTATEDEFETYTASTISFESTDDIKDSAAGLTFIRNHEMIEIIGSSGQDGFHYTDSASHNHVTTDTGFGGQITNEAAGASITIDQGNSITVAENVTRAAPGAAATVVAHGKRIDQSFTIPETGSFTVGEVIVRVRKVGTPSAGVKVSLANDSAGSVGTLIEAITVAPADISDTLDDTLFAFANTSTLTFGTTYHVVVQVDGGVDSPTDYYMVDVAEADESGVAPYTAGTLKVWNGSSWVARTPAASLAFEIWGHQTTTQQLIEVVSAAGQFGLSVSVRNSSSLPKRQYRVGKFDALNEFDDLLEAGTNGAKRLIVKPQIGSRTLVIEQEADPDSIRDLVWRDDDKLYWPTGAPFEPGVLVPGRWVTLADVPVSVSRLARISPMFVEKDSYNADTDTHDLDPRGARSVWDLGKIKNG